MKLIRAATNSKCSDQNVQYIEYLESNSPVSAKQNKIQNRIHPKKKIQRDYDKEKKSHAEMGKLCTANQKFQTWDNDPEETEKYNFVQHSFIAAPENALFYGQSSYEDLKLDSPHYPEPRFDLNDSEVKPNYSTYPRVASYLRHTPCQNINLEFHPGQNIRIPANLQTSYSEKLLNVERNRGTPNTWEFCGNSFDTLSPNPNKPYNLHDVKSKYIRDHRIHSDSDYDKSQVLDLTVNPPPCESLRKVARDIIADSALPKLNSSEIRFSSTPIVAQDTGRQELNSFRLKNSIRHTEDSYGRRSECSDEYIYQDQTSKYFPIPTARKKEVNFLTESSNDGSSDNFLNGDEDRIAENKDHYEKGENEDGYNKKSYSKSDRNLRFPSPTGRGKEVNFLKENLETKEHSGKKLSKPRSVEKQNTEDEAELMNGEHHFHRMLVEDWEGLDVITYLMTEPFKDLRIEGDLVNFKMSTSGLDLLSMDYDGWDSISPGNGKMLYDYFTSFKIQHNEKIRVRAVHNPSSDNSNTLARYNGNFRYKIPDKALPCEATTAYLLNPPSFAYSPLSQNSSSPPYSAIQNYHEIIAKPLTTINYLPNSPTMSHSQQSGSGVPVNWLIADQNINRYAIPRSTKNHLDPSQSALESHVGPTFLHDLHELHDPHGPYSSPGPHSSPGPYSSPSPPDPHGLYDEFSPSEVPSAVAKQNPLEVDDHNDEQNPGSLIAQPMVRSEPIARVKNRPGRPKKPENERKRRAKRSGRVWEYIRDLLHDPATCPSLIRWEDASDGVFKLVKSDQISHMWGMRKDNHGMTYEKFSRAMRYYYKSKIFKAVKGKRLIYSFGDNAKEWRAKDMNNPNFTN